MPRTAVGLVALVGAGYGLALRYVSLTNHATFISSALSPYLTLGAPLAAVLLLWGRRWVLGVVAIGLTVAAVAAQAPLYIHPTARRAADAEVRVLTANLHNGNADPDSFVRSARDHADVVAVQELTPDEADGLARSGLDTTFPYRHLDPREGPGGAGMWSRFPISTSADISGYTFALLTAHIRIAGLIFLLPHMKLGEKLFSQFQVNHPLIYVE